MRQVALHEQYSHFDVTRNLVDNRAFLSNKGIMSLSPLYIYPDPTKKSLFDTDEFGKSPSGRYPNISSAFINDLAKKLGMSFISDGNGNLQETFGSEDIFDYMFNNATRPEVFVGPMARNLLRGRQLYCLHGRFDPL